MRAIKTLAMLLLAGLLLAAGGLWWLLGSGGGRELLLGRALAALPEGQLVLGEREGSLAGGLRLRGLVFDDGRQRIEIERLELGPLRPRIGGLALRSLRAEGVRVWQREGGEAPPSPPWPEALPTLALPLGLDIEALALRGLRVWSLPVGEAPSTEVPPRLQLDEAGARLRLRRGELALEALALRGPGLALAGRLAYAPARDFATALQLEGEAAGLEALALRLEGRLAAGELQLQARAGGPLALRGGWRDAGSLDTLAWTLEASGEALTYAEAAPLDLGLRLAGGRAAAAPGHAVALEGRVVREGLAIDIAPSQLRLDGERLHLDALVLGLLDGRLTLRGEIALDEARARLEAEGRGLIWGEGEARVQADATAQVEGRLEDWQAALRGELRRGAQQARIEAEARREGEALRLPRLRFDSPGGGLEGEARLGLAGDRPLALEARLRALDPSWLLPGWPGRLDGRLSVSGTWPAKGAPALAARLEGLTGQLRGQPLSGRLALDSEAGRSRGEAELALGEGRLRASGRLAPEFDLEASLRRLPLAPWLEGAEGIAALDLRLAGRHEDPRLEARLSVLAPAYAGWTAEGLEAKAAGRLSRLRHRLVIEGLAGEGFAPREGPAGRIEAEGGWQRPPGGASRLTLSRLDARLPRLPAATLAEPVDVRFEPRGWRLASPACLGLGRSGRLCAEGDARELRLDGSDLLLSWLGPFLPEGEGQLRPVGRLSLEARLEPLAPALRGELRLASPRGRLRSLGGASEAALRWEALRIDAARGADGLRLEASAGLPPEGRLIATLRADAAGALDGRLTLEANDLGIVEAFVADLAEPRGELRGELRVAGTLEAPRWSGELALAPFHVELPALGIAVEAGELRASGDEGGRLRLEGRLPTGDGALALAGDWQPGASPIRLGVRGEAVRVLDTPEARAWISPELEVEVQGGVARVRGRVAVPRALLQVEQGTQSVPVSADVVVVDAGAPEAAPGPALDADLRLVLGEDVRLVGYGFDGRVAGELRVRDRIDREPRATGTLELSGGVRAYGQALRLTRGSLRWANAPLDQPVVDVRAERPDTSPEVGVALAGTPDRLRAEVWSQPPLPQAEALSLLMFGRPLSTADGQDAAQLEQAALALGGNAVAQAFAGAVGLDVASVGQSRALGGTALTVGKRITPKLYVSYGMSLSGAGQVFGATYALRRWLSLQLESSEEQRLLLEARFDRD